ncbi:MAG: DUF1501 domain-containing protein [Planctomycetaceae bacterium]|nr:DUF1501 domain-containing protein [Planctomycetaceae bacterium]
MITRRNLLSMLAGMGLSLRLPAMSARAAAARRTERPKSIITLWMGGGMSQLETWDPHPGTKSGGEVTAISTTAKDILISNLLPRVAEQMHLATLIRSLTSKEGDHERGTKFVKTGYRPEPTLKYPSLGAIAALELQDPSIEIPQHIALCADQPFSHGGYLGNQWDAFRVFNPGQGINNLENLVSNERSAKRMKGLEVVSQSFGNKHRFGLPGTLHQETMEKALTMMSSEQLKAFRLDEESESVKASYGDTRFGRGCLVARRLVEVGVRAVEVTLSGFDTHASNHEGHVTQCEILDPALATLLRELSDRDLLESTIVLCISEFGRTPSINPAGGRDHWPNWFSCLVAGGGFRQGALVGSTPAEIPTSKDASPTEAITIPTLYSTIMRVMGIDFSKEVLTPIGRPIRFSDAEPADWLLS